jgi:dihydroxy-acid dehydratase
MISIDAETGRLDVEISSEELANRKAAWSSPQNPYQSGVLWKYAQEVGPARAGAVTHPGAKKETVCYADQ